LKTRYYEFMMLALNIFLILSLCTLSLAINPNPDTVPELDVSKYLGLWYQMAADKIVYTTFERDAYCATAMYGDNGDGTLSVHNYATIGSPTGDVYVIDGKATQTDPENYPGKLTVEFNSDDAAPFPAPYWVLELGPINSDGLYDYAIVSDNLSEFLFVLARNVDTFNTKYKTQVYATLDQLGFKGQTKPIDIYQGSDCMYESSKTLKAPELKPETVDSLDVNSYLGLWYQVYADSYVINSFEKDAYCVTAKYGDNGDGKISVHNYETVGAPNGTVSVIDGYAYQTNAEEEPGQLKVYFPNGGGAPFPAPYWVLELGPINDQGLYDYSIVSDSLSAYLFVLTRDTEKFYKEYNDQVLKSLESFGFKGNKAPIKTYQNTDCVYE